MIFRYLLVICLYTCSILAYSQSTLKVQIIDEGSNEPLPFANVVLLHPSDSTTLHGATADIEGIVNIKAKYGSYLLWVSFIGYEDYYNKITINKPKIRLKNIKLKVASNQLAEVEVGAAAKMFTTDFDKKVFNVENTSLASGGSAIDLLATLPSIQVNEEGGISLRGSGDVLVFINGRQTSLSAGEAETILSQFPASAIQSVELITNPSARYDASGVGGIINIILKKGQMKGFNGQVNTSVGTNHKYQAGLNLNYRTDQVNYYANYSYQYRELWQIGETDRENFNSGTSKFFTQEFNTTNFSQNHGIRIGFDYEISEKALFGFFANASIRPDGRNRDYLSTFTNEGKITDSSFTRSLVENEIGRNWETGFTYTLKQDKDQNFNIMATYSIDQVDRDEIFDQRFFDATNNLINEKQLYQLFTRDRFNSQGVFQMDYERNKNKNAQWDAGVKITLRDYARPQFLQEGRTPNSNLIINALVTDSFFFRENVYAAYGNYRTQFRKLKIQAGLRAEYTQTRSYQPKLDSNYINNYFNLFPSIYFDYKLKEQQSLLLNYSRRISRPGMWNLGPLLNVQDPFNVRIGSPYLQPSFTDNLELGYNAKWENIFLSTTIFHRYTTNDIARVFEPFGDTAVAITWANANTRYSTGFEWINQWTLNSQIDLNVTANVFYSNVMAPTSEGNVSNENISWTLNLIGNWRIPKIINIQLSSNYRGPIVLPQGEIDPIFYANLGLRKDLWKGKATLALSFTDMFNTQVFRVNSTTNQFTQKRFFNRETRILTLEFTYRFKGFKDKKLEEKMRNSGVGEDVFD